MNEINIIYNEECATGMTKHIPDESIDLVVTSPPYDALRKYNGYSFNFEEIAQELWRVIKPGGVVVWVVGDATIKGSETGTSFRQALHFKDIGFNLHDTMIYQKNNVFGGAGNPPLRYAQSFEYMFVLSKGRPKTFNPLKEKCVKSGKKFTGRTRKNKQSDGLSFDDQRLVEGIVASEKIVKNIFAYNIGFNMSSKDKVAFEHSAIFPEKLAEDHILSWSNPGDIVLDPFMGSGTTAKMAILNDRNYIGFEMSKEYCDIAEERLKTYKLINT